MWRLPVAVILFLAAPFAAGATHDVTSKADSGPGTIRQAILNANASGVSSTIVFHVSSGGAQTILLDSPLPPVTVPTLFDGTTQPGYVNTPLVHLDRNADPEGSAVNEDLLVINAAGTTVRALAFTTEGIAVVLNTADNVVTLSAMTAYTGVDVRNAPRNQILTNAFGGTTGPAIKVAGNNTLVSGNAIDESPCACTQAKCVGPAILVSGNQTRVVSNRITASSRSDVGAVTMTGDNNVFGDVAQGNTVGGFGGTVVAPQAVTITGKNNLAAGNSLSNNRTFACGYSTSGMVIGGDVNIIGGTATLARNVIGGGTGTGLRINGNNNAVAGNYLGLDGTGMRANANGGGVFVSGSTNIIGPGNVISGNLQYGIHIAEGSTSNRVETNIIGTSVDGSIALPNVQSAIVVQKSDGNNIGGTVTSLANSITGSPIVIDAGDGNSIRRNGFCDSSIKLINGGNRGQRPPILESAIAGASTSVRGTIDGAPGRLYSIDLFNADCVPNPYLNSLNILTDAAGHTSFFVSVGAIPAGTPLWATATSDVRDTSPLSNIIVVAAATVPRIDRVVPNNGLVGGGTVVTIAGSGFQQGATVTFGGTAAASVTVIDPQTIAATTAPHAAGPVEVTVRNPDGQTVTLAGGFTFTNCSTTPALVVSPSSAVVPINGSATLMVDTRGLDALSVQWYRRFSDHVEAVTGESSLVFVTPALTVETTYYAIVTTPCGITETQSVTLRIGSVRRRSAPH